MDDVHSDYALENRIADLEEQISKLQKFKDFVHARLDAYGVPHDPDPEGNKKHGCRISGRLKWLHDENEDLKQALRESASGIG